MEKFLFILFIIVISYFTNFIWENLHYPFYTILKKRPSFICVSMDAIIILLLYLTLAFVFHNFFWIKGADYKSIVFTVILGGITGIIIEKVSLLLNLWDYNEKMPKVPIVRVGLWPVLQLMILPIITYFASYFLVTFISEYFQFWQCTCEVLELINLPSLINIVNLLALK